MYKHLSYFGGVNCLRFIAASLVLLHHLATIGKKYGFFDLEGFGLFRNGTNAVNFFFVLSGFLITYLLQKEIAKTQSVDIKHFYLRRIKRIWPLYFLLIGFGTVVLPFAVSVFDADYTMPYSLGETWYYFVFFCPILVLHFFGHHLLEPLWSIGVEEVFYLFWAPLVRLAKKRLGTLILSVLILKTLLNVAVFFLADEAGIVRLLVFNYNFESMAVGALGAYLLFNSKRRIENTLLFKPLLRWVVCGLVAVFLCFNINVDNALWRVVFFTPVLSPLILSFLYLYVILCAVLFCGKDSFLERRPLVLFGEISYGIYVYHTSVMFFLVLLLGRFANAMPAPLFAAAFLFLTFALTLTLAYFSKRYFEDFFLGKGRYEKR